MPTNEDAVAAIPVLVAEDDVALARSVDRILSSEGFAVTLVHDGASAVQALATKSFDVVLSDIQMPQMTGVELLRAVRMRDLDLPVILMTSDPSLDTAIEALELGALRYLKKPVPNDELVAVARRASQLRRLARMKREAFELLGRSRDEAGDRAGLMANFDRALASLWIAFQPIVGAHSSEVFAYEALLRTTEPSLPNPPAVLAAAEQLDRLPELGRRIRTLAAEGFVAHAPDNVLLFVNLHPRDLADEELCSKDTPLARIANRVVLEITERAPLHGVDDVMGRVRALRDLGFRIAVDDLGAGYAGLTSFAALEPEFVKLDMSLVQNVDASPVRQKLIASMSALCTELGTRVVAEGIEREQERDEIRSLGCELMQGYFFARPARLGK